MSSKSQSPVTDLELPRPRHGGHDGFIEAPSLESFTLRFGDALPMPHFIHSELGRTAIYNLPPPSGHPKRQVLVLHGLNTPALGMLPLAKELQALDPNAHIILHDLWGHGFSTTPLLAHTPHLFHHQIFQVLGFMQWAKADIVGFSFGGLTTVTFARHNPWMASSVATIAPGGLLRRESFDVQMQELLDDSKGKDTEAAKYLLSWLEGGKLVVPPDAQQRMKSGEVVAEAIRQWEVENHQGYPYSILSAFRDGGVYGSEDAFRTFAQGPVKKIAILGEFDNVSNKDQMASLGFERIEVVKNADHDFIRKQSGEIANLVHRFWTGKV